MQWDKLCEHSEHFEALVEKLRDAAKDAAKLAKAAAHTMRSQQRPWLGFDDLVFQIPTATQPYQASVRVTNYGGSPAQILSSRVLIECAPPNIPPPPSLGAWNDVPAGGVLVPGQAQIFLPRSRAVAQPGDIQFLQSPDPVMALFAILEIEYRDILTQDVHHSRIGARWDTTAAGSRLLTDPGYHDCD